MNKNTSVVSLPEQCFFVLTTSAIRQDRLSPPDDDNAPSSFEDFPVVTVVKETITAKWSGHGDQVSDYLRKSCWHKLLL